MANQGPGTAGKGHHMQGDTKRGLLLGAGGLFAALAMVVGGAIYVGSTKAAPEPEARATAPITEPGQAGPPRAITPPPASAAAYAGAVEKPDGSPPAPPAEASPPAAVAYSTPPLPPAGGPSSPPPPAADSPSTSPPPSAATGKTVHVNGYYRKDGTYVRPHERRPRASKPKRAGRHE